MLCLLESREGVAFSCSGGFLLLANWMELRGNWVSNYSRVTSSRLSLDLLSFRKIEHETLAIGVTSRGIYIHVIRRRCRCRSSCCNTQFSEERPTETKRYFSRLIKRVVLLRLYVFTVKTCAAIRLVVSNANACESTHAMASDGHRGQNPRRLACGRAERQGGPSRAV